MGQIFSYTLTASVTLFLLYPVLRQIVNRSTFFCFNRIVIICCLVLCLSMPCLIDADFISLRLDMPIVSDELENNITHQFTETIFTDHTPQNNPTALLWLPILLIVYFSGVFVLFCREIISFLRLIILIRRSEKTKNGKYTICRIKDNRTAPFSWRKYIFLQDLEVDSTDSIYIHEKAHTDKRHWIDVIFADLFCIILWYNPFVWMTRQLMKTNHEFEADSAVISSGIDTYTYQRLLIMKAMGMKALPVSNSFAADKRSFRKRVLIMGRESSSRKPMLVALFAIPALIVSVIIVSTPTSAKILSFISDYSFNKDIFTQKIPEQSNAVAKVSDIKIEMPKGDIDAVTIIPNPLEDQTALAEIVRHSLETIDCDKETKVNIEIVVDEDGNIKDILTDSDGALIATAIKQNLKGIKFEQILHNGTPIEAHFKLPIQIGKQK